MTQPSISLLIFGHGYSGRAIAALAVQKNIPTTITSRTPGATPNVISFTSAHAAIAAATHLITTAAPNEHGDPILNAYKAEITAAPNLKYLGYLSTTGVYGDQNGAWVDEDTQPNAASPRARRRLEAEAAWADFAPAKTVDIFRLAGIYGPGRSMLDDLRAGNARHIVKPGHAFSRIHVDDIAHGVLTAMTRTAPPGATIFNFTDDEPAPSADVVLEAARLLNLLPPPPIPFDLAAKTMSPMALSFWSDNRRVANQKTKSLLNLVWLHPTYREGLRAILNADLDHE